MTIPSNINQESEIILTAYINFCDKYNKTFDVHIRDRHRKKLIQQYRNLPYPPFKITNNMVPELFETILREK